MKLGDICCGALAVVIATTLSARAAPLQIRMDWFVVPGHFAPLIPTVPKYNPNVYRHYGGSYVVEPMRLQGGGASLTALATGDINIIGTMSPQLLVLAVTQAKLNIKVIAQALTTEKPGYLKTYFWVRGSDVKSVKDLRGKVIAVPALGTNIDAAQQVIMRRAGMRAPSDYRVVEIPFSAMIPALESKEVDAVPLVPPFNLMASKDPKLAPLFSVGEAFGGPVETLMFGAKSDFIAGHQAALVDFLEDNMRMRRWMTNPKTRMQAVEQLSDISKLPESAYSSWAYTDKDYYYDQNAVVNVDLLQKNINTLAEVGVIPTKIDAKKYVDLSLAEEAAARLKH
jgi:NitT/TauT family transport system substrate-binding protein